MKYLSLLLISTILFGCYSENTKHRKYLLASVKPLPAPLQLIMQNLQYQMKQTKNYDPSYVALSYPNGDVPIETGVCADVVVRAFRANNIDLQKELHEDMSKYFSVYPNNWNLSQPDKNIDHRRVPNLMTFFERKGKAKPIANVADDFIAGDVVAWKLPNNLYHIGIVSDDVNELGIPIIVHNIGSGTKKADVLFSWKIIGHYRWFD